jgi:hypothetical protein
MYFESAPKNQKKKSDPREANEKLAEKNAK